MKSTIRKTVTAFGVFFLLLSLGTSKVQAYPDRGVTLQTFYDELSYYGDWIDNPDYGYVWRPNVGRDFRPYYTNGRWAMTEYGNTWVSDYEWGWAPFHYGRWFYDDYDGWVWLPDTVWGPSWVSWRSGGGYYGWAPLGPRISININFGRNYYVPNNHWVFIPQRCIYYPSYARYWEPRRNIYIINNTTYINNIYTYNRNVRCYTGPRADEIRRVTRQNVPVYRITDDDRPGSTRVDRGNVRIYRPEIKGDSRDAAPRTIANNTGRPNRSDDNGVNRGGASNPSIGTGRPQRPDATTAPRTSDNTDVNRGSSDNRSSRSDANPSSTDRPVRSSSPSVDRGSAPVRQEPSRGDNDNRTIQRPDAPIRVERPTPSPRQEPSSSSGSNSRPERSQPTQPAPRQETRTESAPRQETRTESRPQRSEPAPRQQETRSNEPQKESSSSRTETSRPSARPGNRGN